MGLISDNCKVFKMMDILCQIIPYAVELKCNVKVNMIFELCEFIWSLVKPQYYFSWFPCAQWLQRQAPWKTENPLVNRKRK